MKLSRVVMFIALAIPLATGAAEVTAVNDAEVRSPTATKSASPSSANAVRAADRIDLETSVVTGNRELPKVLYIVPWKKAELGDLPEQPFNTLLDEALAPLDRDEFRREVSFYSTLSKRQMSGPAGPVATPVESVR